jgi:membrane protein
VRQLFATDTARGTTTVLSSLVTIVFAYSWPAELQRGYQLIWDLPSRGMRDGWRPAIWLLSFFAVVGCVASSGSVAGGTAGTAVVGVVGSPVVFAWTWWTQHLFLGGRTPYRRLVAGAVATTIGLFGLSLYESLFLSSAITQGFDKYGPIGVVFALLSWLIGFNVVMLGGPLAGHVWVSRRE